MGYLTGITKDAGGAPLPGVTVKVFDTLTDEFLGDAISNGDGEYYVPAIFAEEVYAVAFLSTADSPPTTVAGASRNDVVPEAGGGSLIVIL